MVLSLEWTAKIHGYFLLQNVDHQLLASMPWCWLNLINLINFIVESIIFLFNEKKIPLVAQALHNVQFSEILQGGNDFAASPCIELVKDECFEFSLPVTQPFVAKYYMSYFVYSFIEGHNCPNICYPFCFMAACILLKCCPV